MENFCVLGRKPKDTDSRLVKVSIRRPNVIRSQQFCPVTSSTPTKLSFSIPRDIIGIHIAHICLQVPGKDETTHRRDVGVTDPDRSVIRLIALTWYVQRGPLILFDEQEFKHFRSKRTVK